jgi:hypothetical protein
MRKILVFSIFAMLILGLLPATFFAQATDSTEVLVVPPTISFDTSTATIGTPFNLSVYVKGVDDMKTWQVKMSYNHSVINITRWYEPTWDASYVFYGKGTLPVPAPPGFSYGSVSATEGWVGVGCSLFPAPSSGGGFTGDGLLCILEFEVKTLPGKYEQFTSDFDITYTADTFWIRAGESAKNAYDVYTNGDYSIDWVLPPKPKLAVDPSYREFSPWVDAVGQTFNETVLIKGLDPAWGLTNVTFSLCFNSTLIDVVDITPDALWGTPDIAVVHTTPWDHIDVTLKDPTTTPGGDVALIEIQFEVLYQGEVPPRVSGDYDETPLFFCGDYTLFDHVNEIETLDPIEGLVRIYCLMTLPLAWLEVVDPTDGDHEIVIGPEPSIDKEFEVNVIIKNMHPEWHLIGYQFRLLFDDTLMEGVDITEGPFLTDSRWNKYGTIFASRFDPPISPFESCAVVGGILWPNPADGNYEGPFPQAPGPNVTDLDPPVDPVLATIKFRAIAQEICCPTIDLTCALEIVDTETEDKYFYGVDTDTQEKSWLPFDEHVDGEYTMLGSTAMGRVIDLYGGIEGDDPFPAPYGGQGPNNPMDMVWPQKLVILYADVTYNCWPVQNKIVAFEVESLNSEYEWLFKGTAISNETGTAKLTFRMPWQCFNGTKYFGVYKVTATVDVACTVINDTMKFHYDYLINIFKVTTDKFYYEHCEDVVITVEYGSYAMQPPEWEKYPAEFWVYISDELGQPIGYDVQSTFIGGAKWCQYNNGTFIFRIHVPKWAFSGYAYVHVNCFNMNPSDGGFAWCPEYTCAPHCPQSGEPYPTIYILPSWV